MKNTSITICALIMGFAITGIVHSNAAVTTLGVVSEESSQYFDDSDGLYSSANISAPAPLGNFTHNFSSLGEEVWTVTWQAPVGQYIEIAAPTGWDSISLQVRAQTGGSFGSIENSHTPLSPVTVTLSGEMGDLLGAPANNYMALPAGSTTPGPGFATGAIADIFWNLTPGQTYRFTSIEMSGTIPAGSNTDVNQDFSNIYISGNATSGGSSVPDPGQWVSLQAIPEPSHALLSLVGIAAIGLRRRRS